MAEIKAIETIYNGYRFRSRLEEGGCNGILPEHQPFVLD